MLGMNPPPKITYDRWIWQLAELADAKGFRIFFLGGMPGVAEKAAQRICQRFPRLEIAGTHHGHFGKDGEDNARVIAAINETKPDILLLGFGMPIQEQWLRDHWSSIDAHVLLTGGAVFDYASGQAKRAPSWMIRLNLEWLFRFIREPRRLFVRYAWGNPYFAFKIFQQKWFSGGRAEAVPFGQTAIPAISWAGPQPQFQNARNAIHRSLVPESNGVPRDQRSGVT
jgi:N-acetylglucosaminyldiphosphoundecaprenol N-acetyl-beta-D-mannosaminyltransferase